jgi:16S rRNA (guanine527-N7)-methyltransferase
MSAAPSDAPPDPAVSREAMAALEFQRRTGVSDDTLERLRVYLDVLGRWQDRMNLVAPSTLADPWRRHMLDSAQLLPYIPKGTRRSLDMGSGAGFPGMVLAILGISGMHLVDADSRKCRFLANVSRETNTAVDIINNRLEALPPMQADVLTARACAPLRKLLKWAQPHLKKGGIGLFMKGRRYEEELTEAAKEWDIQFERIPSVTDASGMILKVGEIRRHHAR